MRGSTVSHCVSHSRYGGGSRATYTVHSALSRCILCTVHRLDRNTGCGTGGGIMLDTESATSTNKLTVEGGSSIHHCSAPYGLGGGIFAYGSTEIAITDGSSVSDCVAHAGGCMYKSDTGLTTIDKGSRLERCASHAHALLPHAHVPRMPTTMPHVPRVHRILYTIRTHARARAGAPPSTLRSSMARPSVLGHPTAGESSPRPDPSFPWTA